MGETVNVARAPVSLPTGDILVPEHDKSCGGVSPAWDLIENLSLGKSSNGIKDRAFWRNTTGNTLAILLEKAGYSQQNQSQLLFLYDSAVVPELGPGPRTDGSCGPWNSFMTDHHCPVEFSWEWNRKAERPTIRFSFEPIGAFAGTPNDRLNQYAAAHFVREHQAKLKGCDLLWYQHLSDNLVSFNDSPSAPAYQESEIWEDPRHKSRCFLALDLNESSLVLKAYFMPAFKARDTQLPVMSVIYDTIESLPCLSEKFRASYRAVRTFLSSHPSGQYLAPEIVAVDCISPEQSRIKIYMRSPLTSFASVKSTMCLGGAISQDSLGAGMQELQKVWHCVFGQCGGENLDDELPTTSHRTGGMLYYFEMSSRKQIPTVKVYLPLRHYGKSDSQTASCLQKYLRTTSRTDYSDKYVEALNSITESSAYPSLRGLQTYLACAVTDNELRIVSYLAPHIYRTV